MDPGSAFYDHFRGGEAPSEVAVVSRFRIHDQVAVAVDFFAKYINFWTKVLIFDIFESSYATSWPLQETRKNAQIDAQSELPAVSGCEKLNRKILHVM